MARLMNSMFSSQPLGGNGGSGDSTWLPAVDIHETEDSLVLSFDLPGMKEDDIQIELDENVLTVSGQRDRQDERKDDSYYRYERRFGAFSRSVALPAGVNDESVDASYENGVLEIRVRKPEEYKPKRIQIGGGSSQAIEGKGTRK
jgi:HSP20 family protein